MRRREFLMSGAALAFGFGLAIRSSVTKTSDPHFTILYATRYGATRDTSFWIGEGLGPNTKIIDITQNDHFDTLNTNDYLIVGSGIWTGLIHGDLGAYLGRHAISLENRVLATFIVCGTRPNNETRRARIEGYLQQINGRIKGEPQFSQRFGGRLNVAQLNESDRIRLTTYYQRKKKELVSWDRTDKNVARLFGRGLTLSQ